MTVALLAIKGGWFYDRITKTMLYDPGYPNMRINEDLGTFQILQNIANDLDQNIQVLFDIPSNNHNNKVTVLDLELWIGEKNEVNHSFYRKPIASNFTILYRSATPGGSLAKHLAAAIKSYRAQARGTT